MNQPELRTWAGLLPIALALGLMLLWPGNELPRLYSDPCGMVPPIYTGPGVPISRIGLQQTYVFHDQGMESIVIRPGFRGKVDNFGMLIPFPAPPAIRKVPDNIFEQIAAAVDPPEVIVDLRPPPPMAAMAMGRGLAGGGGAKGLVLRDEVRVLSQEAIGMYEVAVLAAGSSAALQRWMDQNGYQYPQGMDAVTEDYIDSDWCFVAVKTRVGSKAGADPQPGQRQTAPVMPEGSVFDGNVQGLGFRFPTKQLVVPMRLSAFNEGELRNVVYLVTRGGRKIRSIPEEFVVRQIPGKQLVDNLTQPLAVRIIGGPARESAIPEWRRKSLDEERKPEPHNGLAKQLFVSDLLAADSGELALPHEEAEKELLRINEHLGLRGPAIDQQLEAMARETTAAQVQQGVRGLRDFTLTVVDGDFPRAVIAEQNLTFANFQMNPARNLRRLYDTRLHRPGGQPEGELISQYLDGNAPWPTIAQTQPSIGLRRGSWAWALVLLGLTTFRRRRLRLPPDRQVELPR